jgi:hypothetical protein
MLVVGAVVGLANGVIAAMLHHYDRPGGDVGWYGYAPLSDVHMTFAHPGWWPTLLVLPLVFAAAGLVVAAAVAALLCRRSATAP